jgi:hypothetical protein
MYAADVDGTASPALAFARIASIDLWSLVERPPKMCMCRLAHLGAVQTIVSTTLCGINDADALWTRQSALV